MAATYGMTTPIMSSVMPNPATTTNTVSSMGVQGLPMSSALPIIVNESTPNLAEIQSFPVIVSGGGIHIHQDPVTGQRYRMTDEFHSRIPQILAGNSIAMRNMVGGGLTGGTMPVSANDIKIISDNIENYSTILVTESTPNLSEILSYEVYGSESGYTFYMDSTSLVIYIVSDNLKNKSTLILQTRDSGLQNFVLDQITESDIFNMIPTISVFTNQSDLESTISQQRSQVSNVNQSVIVNRSRYVYPNLSNRTSLNRVSNFASSIISINRFRYPSLR